LNARQFLLSLLGTVILSLGSMAAHANRVLGEVLTGTVTRVSSESVTIEGHEYHIRSGSPAAQAVTHVAPGQEVEVHLDGPADSSRSEVINVITHK